MTLQNAFVTELVLRKGNTLRNNLVAVLSGTALIAAVAQIAIPLPFTPVPITGQTFGVALLSLLWGRARGVSAVALYLFLGIAGMPVFALGKSGVLWGPTAGYLLGMLAASYVVGGLADRGWTQSFLKTWLAAICGSLLVFSGGVTVLAFFLPKESLFVSGVLPFLPGDLIKNILAAFIARQVAKSASKDPQPETLGPQ